MNPKPQHIGEGLTHHDNGAVSPPRVVMDHHHAGYAVIPMSAEKRPLVEEWKPYQERQPTPEEIREWIQHRGSEIVGWARVTGAHSGIIVVDFDGDAANRLQEWGLSPHVMTGSGGYHLIVKHPGWRVKTCNSKSSKKHWEHYPNIDIRGDGGYSLIAGFDSRGGYTWLRDYTDIDELDVLPIEFRKYFGLLEAPAESEPVSAAPRERSALRSTADGVDDGPTPENLVNRALGEASLSGRNNGGFWLVGQLWDNGYDENEILEVGELYIAQCPETNLKGEAEAYTLEDYRRTMKQVLARPRRDKWGEGDDVPILADFGEELKMADDTTSAFNIYDYLVPTEVGVLQEYAEWAIEDVVRIGSRTILYGESGAAKSYVVVDLARAAVTGGTWLGKKVLPGSVVYVAAEDYLGIHHRTETTIRHCGVERYHRVLVFERSLPITNREDVKILLQGFDRLEEKPRYVIIDNLSLCMGDGDPNDGVAAKAFVDGCDLFQRYKWREESSDEEVRATDVIPITVVVVHHTNKVGNFNGSQYFKNFVDAQSELVWDGKGLGRTLYARKQRQGQHHEPLPFDLVEVDPERKICVVRSTSQPPPQTDTEKAWRNLLSQEERILTVLREAELERFLQMGEEKGEIPRGLERADITVRSNVCGRSVGRILNAMRSAGFVEPVMEEVEDSKGSLKLKKVYPDRFQLTDGGREVVDRGFEGVRVQRGRGRPKKSRDEDGGAGDP